ncbi:MAG TPA: hypothetical protein VG295_14010 [Solirubrobacteraceae bacterium]|nr:hypothetical protein [Solirubrobacteraceae bacterium]
MALAVAGCGSSAKSTSATTRAAAAAVTAPTVSATRAGTGIGSVLGAENLAPAPFPPARHRTLPQLGALASRTATLMPATGVLTPGTRRFAFGLTASSGEFIYGATALYIARSANSPASGPYLAPADPLGVAAAYRSNENDGAFGLQAIYHTDLPLPRAGTYTILAMTRVGGRLLASPTEIAVAPSSPIPDVGQRPPAIATDTLASTGGKVALLTTRHPAESMHSVSFRDALGKRPIALLFSTPELCTSKVCGPVTDLTVEAQHEFGSRMTFIHEEVYVGNDPAKGYRPQLRDFHLETEPWLFTINRHGVIAARLEGAFGMRALRRAIEAALG